MSLHVLSHPTAWVCIGAICLRDSCQAHLAGSCCDAWVQGSLCERLFSTVDDESMPKIQAVHPHAAQRVLVTVEDLPPPPCTTWIQACIPPFADHVTTRFDLPRRSPIRRPSPTTPPCAWRRDPSSWEGDSPIERPGRPTVEKKLPGVNRL